MKESILLVGFVLWFGGLVATIFLADTKDRGVGRWLLLAALLPTLSVLVLVFSRHLQAHAVAACIPAVTPVLLALLPRAGAADARSMGRENAVDVAPSGN